MQFGAVAAWLAPCSHCLRFDWWQMLLYAIVYTVLLSPQQKLSYIFFCNNHWRYYYNTWWGTFHSHNTCLSHPYVCCILDTCLAVFGRKRKERLWWLWINFNQMHYVINTMEGTITCFRMKPFVMNISCRTDWKRGNDITWPYLVCLCVQMSSRLCLKCFSWIISHETCLISQW